MYDPDGRDPVMGPPGNDNPLDDMESYYKKNCESVPGQLWLDRIWGSYGGNYRACIDDCLKKKYNMNYIDLKESPTSNMITYGAGGLSGIIAGLCKFRFGIYSLIGFGFNELGRQTGGPLPGEIPAEVGNFKTMGDANKYNSCVKWCKTPRCYKKTPKGNIVVDMYGNQISE